MLNVTGVVHNNSSTTEFLEFLKKSEKQYPNLSKAEEREMIERMRKDNDDELRNLLVMHNIRYVFNLAKKYAQKTVDFDNLIAKGLYGLVVASKKFDYDYLQNGEHVKFNTYATKWILKYLRQEFNDKKTLMIDNNSISLDITPRIKNSDDGSETMENYIDGMMSPDVKTETIEDKLSASDMTGLYGEIFSYINSDNSSLSSMEKHILIDTFYHNKKTKDIAEDLGSNVTTIINKKKRALDKVRKMLCNKRNIHSMDDIRAF